MIKKRLNEINAELKKLQRDAATKNIGRESLGFIEKNFDITTKKYKALKDEIAHEEYQLTSEEETLAQEVDENSTVLKKTIVKLRDFLKMPQDGTSVKLPSSEKGPLTLSSQDMTAEERQKILRAIKTLAPELYTLMIQVDPTGEKHILKDYYNKTLVSVRPSFDTGLPIIGVGEKAFGGAWEEMLFTIGHELSHYVLGHQLDEYHHDYAPGNLLVKARNRLRQNEADRMSILEFGNSVDAGIATAKGWLQRSQELTLNAPHKETFKDTHPLSVDRIKNMEALRSEAELNKARNRPQTPINWKELVEGYKKIAQPKPVDSALVQKYVNKTYSQSELDNYINKVTLRYERDGDIRYFVQPDKNRRGKPWTTDTIADFLGYCLGTVDESIKNRYFAAEKDEAKLASDVLHTYYNAKLFALRYPNSQEIKALAKGTLEELLNKEIAGKSIATIIQKFEQ
jgi:hypothetical protein